MHTNLSVRGRKIFLGFMLCGMILLLFSMGSGSPIAHAQNEVAPLIRQNTFMRVTLSDGTTLQRHNINGPLLPPPGFESERQPITLPKSNSSTSKMLGGPGTDAWVDGCSVTAAARIAAIYDERELHSNLARNLNSGSLYSSIQSLAPVYEYPNLYTGPTNGGVMPMDNSLWPKWTDIAGDTYSNNPLTASHKGVDGRTIRGTIDDYWVSYDSPAPDPYITGGWQQHAWESLGDYMFTSQSAFDNRDGQTAFFFDMSGGPATCDDLAAATLSDGSPLPDGTLGRKRFYESRGYAVAECYNQLTDNIAPGVGFSFAQFKAEIDAGRPVMLGLDNHSVVGIGYDAPSQTIYINDGWDFNTHSMHWGGSYVGMALHDVSIVNLAPVSPFPSDADTAGVFRPSNGLLYLKNSNNTGFADIAINYGMGGDYPVVGDWDGDGTATIGIYRGGKFYLRNSNTVGFADWVFPFGQVGDQPIAGDWNGDGIDTIGVYRPSNGQFLLRNSNDAGSADAGSFFLGNPGDVGIAGDWTGKGFDTVGVFRPSNGIIFLKNTNQTGFADIALNYGIPGDRPVTGDWNDDGVDTIGVYRNGKFMLRNSNDVGFADIVFGLGNPGDMPIAGNWDGLP